MNSLFRLCFEAEKQPERHQSDGSKGPPTGHFGNPEKWPVKCHGEAPQNPEKVIFWTPDCASGIEKHNTM